MLRPLPRWDTIADAERDGRYPHPFLQPACFEARPGFVKRLSQRIILYFAATDFVRRAITDRADLAAFRDKPTPTAVLGVIAISLSFLLGWPAIAALGVLAVKWHQPWLVVVGGPVTYGISHLVFLLGMYLSGAVYSLIFCRWLTRITMERCLAWAATGQRCDPEE